MKYLVLYNKIKPTITDRLKKYATFEFKKVNFDYKSKEELYDYSDGYNGVVLITDGNMLIQEEGQLWGKHYPYRGKSIMLVEGYKNKKRGWKKTGLFWELPEKRKGEYDATTYTLEHEIGHSLCFLYGMFDTLHLFIKVKLYEKWWDSKHFPTLPEPQNEPNSETNPIGERGLLPKLERDSQEFIKEAKRILGLDIRITSGFRSFEEQDELYAQGRTKPGNIVTNAKGGQSQHNYGIAFDIVDRYKGYDLGKDWYRLALLWHRVGGKQTGWGGLWKSFVDKPHFVNDMGYSLKDFQEGKVDYAKFE